MPLQCHAIPSLALDILPSSTKLWQFSSSSPTTLPVARQVYLEPPNSILHPQILTPPHSKADHDPLSPSLSRPPPPFQPPQSDCLKSSATMSPPSTFHSRHVYISLCPDHRIPFPVRIKSPQTGLAFRSLPSLAGPFLPRYSIWKAPECQRPRLQRTLPFPFPLSCSSPKLKRQTAKAEDDSAQLAQSCLFKFPHLWLPPCLLAMVILQSRTVDASRELLPREREFALLFPFSIPFQVLVCPTFAGCRRGAISVVLYHALRCEI